MRSKLKDLADIRSGYQFRGRVKEKFDGSHCVIQIRDFDDSRKLDSSNLARVSPDRDPDVYLAKPDDVLFLSRGHKLWATYLEDPPDDAIVTGYFFIVRPKGDSIRPRYLAWYFNQAPFQSELRPFVRGTQMPLISLADFEQLKVDVPPAHVQETVVALGGLADREQELMRAIQAKRKRLLDGICLQATHAHHAEEGE